MLTLLFKATHTEHIESPGAEKRGRADLEDAVGSQEDETHDAANQGCKRVKGASDNRGYLHQKQLFKAHFVWDA